MQSATGQVDFNPSKLQLEYVDSHWGKEGVQKISKATSLTESQIYYVAFAILHKTQIRSVTGPHQLGPQTLSEVKVINTHRQVKGQSSRIPQVNLPSIVTKTAGWGFAEQMLVRAYETNDSVIVEIAKKGHSPKFFRGS